MAATKIKILNSSDKTRHYSVAIGEGAIDSATEELVVDVRTYPVGSQYTDLTNSTFNVRVADNKVAADWITV